MREYFSALLHTLNETIQEIDMESFDQLKEECIQTLQSGHRIVTSALGKNVPICEKFVGTMNSLGLDAAFLHTNSAVHGDLGVVHKDDLVIILTKSGETKESVYLIKQLEKKHANLWLMTFTENSTLTQRIDKKLVLHMDHEGDMWDIVPNNSTTLYLIVLQALAIKTAEGLGVTLQEFKENHPGGHIGVLLENE